MTKQKKQTIIFDMDGTLYKFKEGSFRNSKFQKKILFNVRKFIQDKFGKTKKEVDLLLQTIEKDYGENISIALEKKFNINRYDFFNVVWDVPADQYIQKNLKLQDLLTKLKKNFDFLLVSDSPRVWINNVLQELGVENFFTDERIFSGEGDLRKNLNNVFEFILKRFKIKPGDCIVVGDQEETDIIPAKKLGIKTAFINNNGKKSSLTDYNICSILELEKALTVL